ncbi:hypothetical protein [Legionella pneumophila]|uniref:Uncharacterized conserved protein n=1 Tax=Legionella pneumophila subsp. pascullei TaxID=91890 RepID=A0AAX2IZX5_LEGPN|nr:hypothetical protein [Legionella pneumophila]AMP88838.1 hypothetical protein AXF35_03670 [Legionella pneumophila subsp. pascullei]AMP93544.1 hypothetical protein AXF36_13380 [Legionella pneumophila subsp. pascullei]AMP96462.1 hypothetical protein AXF37_13015 [Legionella pneumophila subsp. pascullei]SQG91493.1 Uncharacterized conserved protein [Legionella pneumophila subsp. pascullei]VEH08039.1 Uncharacterized conserved protein [Legionella pneumophila subsp. pascullei]
MSFTLSELLHYKNEKIVTHFCHSHPEYSMREGLILFEDLLAWMWLNKQRNLRGKKTYLFGPLLIIDEMWHSFILHTRDYVDFSMKYFGEYFHHDVEPVGFEHVLDEEELTDFLQDCFQYLNKEWVERRFSKAFAETDQQ